MSQYYTLGTWSAQGGPNYLSVVDGGDNLKMIIRASKTLPYDQINDKYLTVNGSKNILIGSSDPAFSGVDIYARFLIGPGTQKDTFGYFIFDRHDPQNTIPTKFDGVNWVPMTYSDRNAVDAGGKSILKKTIVFPFAKNTDDFSPYYLYEVAGVPSSEFPTGSRVRLLYNTSDPTQLFPNNVGIGFFVIPSGWNSLTSTINESYEAYYTYNVFNDSTPRDQSLLFVDRLNSTKSITNYVIALEDNDSSVQTSINKNFCNCFVQISVFPKGALQFLDNDLVFAYDETILTTKLETDCSGTCIKLSDADFSTLYPQGSNNFIITLSISDSGYRTSLFTLLGGMIKRPGTVISTDGSSFITIEFTLSGNDTQKYIYFIDSTPNQDLASPLNSDISCWQNYYDLYITGNSNITNVTLTMGTGSPIVISSASQTFTANYPYSNGPYYTLGTWIFDGAPDYIDGIETNAGEQIQRAYQTLPNIQSAENFIPVNGSSNILIGTDDPTFIGADVYATFLIGLGTRVTFGYFIFDRHDPQNTIPTKFNGTDWIPMTYSDRNTVDLGGKSILKKTIIFPRSATSELRPPYPYFGATITQSSVFPGGSRVRLQYDTSNPAQLFPNNIGIGFFIIPNGFTPSNATINQAIDAFYTHSTFNNLTPTVQSLLFVDRLNSTDQKINYVLAFENTLFSVSNPTSGKNFVDPIIQISVVPRKSVRILDNDLVFYTNETISTSRLEIDNSGVCIRLSDADLNLLYSSSFNTLTVTYTTNIPSYRTSFYTLLTKIVFRLGTTIIASGLSISISFDINGSDSQKNIYFIDSIANKSQTSPINNAVSCWKSFYDLYVTGNPNITLAVMTVYAEGGASPIINISPIGQTFNVVDPII